MIGLFMGIEKHDDSFVNFEGKNVKRQRQTDNVKQLSRTQCVVLIILVVFFLAVGKFLWHAKRDMVF